MEQMGMTGEQKIAAVQAQIRAIRLGATEAIQCPYCQSMNSEGHELCCELLAHAVMAILDREHLQDCLDHADKIAQVVH